MSSTTNTIILRPRFKFKVNHNNEELLNLFEDEKRTSASFIISRVDNHIFIKIPKEKQHFWSPQLHLEIDSHETENSSTIYGLFGPNPTVWTLFMFLHFVVAGLWIAFAIWTYVNWNLDTDYTIQLFLTLLMVVIWFALYFGGRLGKRSGMREMHELHHFIRDTLRKKGIHTEY
ncbi:GTP-binding protein [Psychroserpens algicola]|uniref:GTP-binding protein n=1 Tax=Psychroserpens algicola TaxID=1719034 RepID=A0ABT0HAG1_9FLAO|nr:GTP-binding protein [Psychroserpens algicola]MCK8481337.1 GTP-binding protein [Psychroserpens algicola]